MGGCCAAGDKHELLVEPPKNVDQNGEETLPVPNLEAQNIRQLPVDPFDNIVLLTDSYKVTHHLQYPPGTTQIYSYFESRGGDFEEVCFFGLQYILKRYLVGKVVTAEKIQLAEEYFRQHFSHPVYGYDEKLFNRANWEHIVEKHNGHLPVVIKAVPEGTILPTRNVLITVENTDPSCYWLTNYLETLLVQVWYPMTVCTQSREQKKILSKYLKQTGSSEVADGAGIDFKLHDFGFRGVSSAESAGIGGAGHLVSFMGTDNLAALVAVKEYYDEGAAGFSIPASEHSTMTTWGREKEADAYRNMLKQYPQGPVSVVSDSYDIFSACEKIWGTELKGEVMGRDGVVVVRPDSGQLPDTLLQVLEKLASKFDTSATSTGHRLLPPQIRVIQGDGIDIKSLERILKALDEGKWAAENLVFGSGGALLQKLHRDSLKCAFKCSYAKVEDKDVDVVKDPVTDRGKRSKRGRLTLVHKAEDSSWTTVTDGKGSAEADVLREVFRDGELLVDETFAVIKERTKVRDEDLKKAKVPEAPAPAPPPEKKEDTYEVGELAEVQIIEGEFKGNYIKAKVLGTGDKPNTYNLHILPTKDYKNASGFSDKDVPDIETKYMRKLPPEPPAAEGARPEEEPPPPKDPAAAEGPAGAIPPRKPLVRGDPFNNIILLTDSYKVTHHLQYPPETSTVYSYFESRGGAFKEVCFFGLQYFLKRYLVGPVVTPEKIDDAQEYFQRHFSDPKYPYNSSLFNRQGWEHICNAHGGHLPISIKAVPEGTVLPTKNVLFTMENTDPQCYWLTNYLETLLVQVWYPMTVCTQSREQKKIISKYLSLTGSQDVIDQGLHRFKLHDFGFRGVSSVESAALGGAAHLVHFSGSDTMAALMMARQYYSEPMAGFSIPASEHSTMTSWGKARELDAMRNMLEQYPKGLVACVSDSYDIWKACDQYWGTDLKAKVQEREGVLTVRPDSGELPETVIKVVEKLGNKFTPTKTSTGHKLLPACIRVIQGDGIDINTLPAILKALHQKQWAADNLVFGSGGALLQKVHRDWLRCAFKCSYAKVGDQAVDVLKDPVTDPDKKSKKGRLTLEVQDGKYQTVQEGKGSTAKDLLVEVFRDGRLLVDDTFAKIKERAELAPAPKKL